MVVGVSLPGRDLQYTLHGGMLVARNSVPVSGAVAVPSDLAKIRRH